MADKINKQTLVLLDWIAFKEHDVPLPQSSMKWIEEHGIPNEKETVAEQKSKIQINKRTAYIDEKKAIMSAIKQYGKHSIQAYKTYEAAYMREVSLRSLAKWSGIKTCIMRYIVNHDKGYWNYRLMISQGMKRYDSAMIRFYKGLIRNGTDTVSDISKWTEIPTEKLESMLALPTQVRVIYSVAIPSDVTPRTVRKMLSGKSKPAVKVNPEDLEDRVGKYMHEIHEETSFELHIDAKYSKQPGIEIKIEK